MLARRSPEVDDIGACNTLVRGGEGWAGYNTDAQGFELALVEFLGLSDLKGLRATLVGAGIPLVDALAYGVVLQAILRNPLAEPYLLGVSAGAALGATIAIVKEGGRPAIYIDIARKKAFEEAGTTFSDALLKIAKNI